MNLHRKFEKRAIKEHLKESGERQEAIIEEAREAGFEDLFEYERYLTGQVKTKLFGVILFVICIATAIIYSLF